ncbi:MAG: choice-of-anchor V domain-containing protein, partial [Candidatus Poseidoniaceae archaeon]
QTGTTPASVSISGLPNAYDVNKLYQVTVSVNGGVQGSSGGFSLEVDKGTLSTGIGLMLVKVNNQGNSATHTITGSSYRSWSFEWTSPAAGSGTVSFEVAGLTTNGNGQNSGDRWITDVVQIPENVPVNNPPSASNALLTPTDARTTDPLSLSYSYSDPDGDSESGSEITWYRDSQALPAGTIQGLTVPSSETMKGQEWYATVRPSDGSDYGNVVTSNTVIIENTPPSLTMPTISPSSADEDDDLTVSYTANDDDQDQLTIEIRWYLDGVLIAEFNDDPTIPSIATRQGDEWRVEVTVSDGDDIESRSSQILTIGGVVQPNNPPEITSAIITPNQPTTINDIQLIYTTQDLDNDAIVDSEIEWRVNNMLTSEISTMVLSTATQKGEIWQAKIRVSDGIDWSDWLVREVLITNTAPIVESVSIQPNLVYTNDSVLVSYEYSDIDGDASNNPAIEWSKNGIEQPALDDLNPLPAEYTSKGDTWTVSLKANDGEAYSETAIQTTFTVQNSLPTISINEVPTNITFANTGLQGIEITPQFSDLDGDAIYQEINWLRNGFREGSLDNATFVPAEYFGAGQIWTLVINYHDNDGPEQQSTWSIEVDNLPPEAIFSTQTTNLWRGEIITVDASESFDLDGVVKNYLWQWQDSEGNSGSTSGKIAEIIGYGTITVTLTVEDDLGLTDTVSDIIVTTQGPRVTGLIATNQDSRVLLSWEWSGEQADFIVLRNSERVGDSNGLSFEDEPLIAGATSYTITPVIDGQALLEGSMTVTDFEVSLSIESNSQVSETGGFVLGLLFLLASIAVISLSLLDRRK